MGSVHEPQHPGIVAVGEDARPLAVQLFEPEFLLAEKLMRLVDEQHPVTLRG